MRCCGLNAIEGGPRMLNLAFRNMKEACHAVQSLSAKPYTSRPWNRNRPDETTWWLVPATDWPAFHLGKLIFEPDEGPGKLCWIGLHVEKGVDPSVAEAFRSTKGRRLIMGAGWTWHKFLDDLRSGAVLKAAEEMRVRTGEPPIVRVTAAYAQDPGDSGGDFVNPVDDVMWSMEKSGQGLGVRREQRKAGILPPAAKAATWSSLPEWLSGPIAKPFVWINAFVAAEFSLAPGASGAWRERQLWEGVLEPLSAWA